MRCLVYVGHPAHFHLFKHVVKILRRKGATVRIVVKDKGVLEDLLLRQNWDYKKIINKDYRETKFQRVRSLVAREWNLLDIVREFQPNVMVGTSAEISHVGSFLKIPSIVVNEDDFHVVRPFAVACYPFAHKVLSPNICDVGPWTYKKISYNGYHELAYLHPKYFTPRESVLNNIGLAKNDPFFLLRFVSLNAYHDKGKSGISESVAERLVSILRPHGEVFITSERQLGRTLEQYRINLHPSNIHHVMYYADMYVGDSQTMAAESAVMGVPSIRFNDFVGEISYLEELENKYNLTRGVKTSNVEKLFSLVKTFLQKDDLNKTWSLRRKRMLDDKINVTKRIVQILLSYG